MNVAVADMTCPEVGERLKSDPVVFVPCGGPTLGYVSAQAATVHFGLRTILSTPGCGGW